LDTNTLTPRRQQQKLRRARTSSLRILLVIEATGKGTGRHILDLAEGSIARGCEVHLIYSPVRMDEMFRKRMWSMDGLAHVALPMHRSIHAQDLSATWAIRRYLANFGPFDVIHGHSSKGGALARIAAIGTGVPAIYTPHALFTLTPGLSAPRRHFYNAIELILSKLCKYIIAVAPAEERFALTVGLGRSRVVMVPNGVGELDLTPRDQARRLCGARSDEVVIGSVGRLIENKGPDVLVKAMAIALRSAPRLRLVFVGDGALKRPLAQLAESLGIADKVVLLGEMDAQKVFSAFDIFAMSSRMEAMPYVVLEAMAAGLPIIATVTSGVEMLVEPSVNGKVVPMDDCTAFAAALVDLASDPHQMAKMASASRRLIEPLSSERMIDRILELYEKCLGESAVELDNEPQLATDVE
jgi:glycosyltransferase involved in cell wall biosynthesis